MRKRIIIFLLLLGILFPIGFLCWRLIEYSGDDNSNKTFLRPELKFTNIHAYRFSQDEIELRGEIILKNHLPFNLEADSISYELYMEGARILQTAYRERLILGARDTIRITLPFLVAKRQVDSIGEMLKQKGTDSTVYIVHYKFYTNARIRKEWNYTSEKRARAFHFLNISLDRIAMNKLKKDGIVYNANLIFRNDNAFPVRIRNVEYFIYLEDDVLSKGEIKEGLEFPAKKTTHVDFPASISYMKLVKLAGSNIPGLKNSRYKLTVSFSIETPNEKFDDARTTITRKGKLEEVFDFNKSDN